MRPKPLMATRMDIFFLLLDWSTKCSLRRRTWLLSWPGTWWLLPQRLSPTESAIISLARAAHNGLRMGEKRAPRAEFAPLNVENQDGRKRRRVSYRGRRSSAASAPTNDGGRRCCGRAGRKLRHRGVPIFASRRRTGGRGPPRARRPGGRFLRLDTSQFCSAHGESPPWLAKNCPRRLRRLRCLRTVIERLPVDGVKIDGGQRRCPGERRNSAWSNDKLEKLGRFAIFFALAMEIWNNRERQLRIVWSGPNIRGTVVTDRREKDWRPSCAGNHLGAFVLAFSEFSLARGRWRWPRRRRDGSEGASGRRAARGRRDAGGAWRQRGSAARAVEHGR